MDKELIFEYIRRESEIDWQRTDPDLTWREWVEDAIDELNTDVDVDEFNIGKFRESEFLLRFLWLGYDKTIELIREFYERELARLKYENMVSAMTLLNYNNM